MVSDRAKATVGLVLALGVLQVAFENTMVFFGSTGRTPTGLANSPVTMVAVPLLISTLLLVILVGGALWHAETLR